MPLRNFVSPHCHVQSLDTGSTPESFAKREQALGTGYITVTDHGSMGACRKVYDLSKKYGLKPILGLEGYFFDPADTTLKQFGIDDVESYANYFHLTLHFHDQQAYEVASRLLSRADDNAPVVFGERKPPFTWADLEELGATNTSIGSGCLGGMVQSHIIDHQRPDVARAYYERLRGVFKPGNFFVEVFPHQLTHDWVNGVYVTFKDGHVEKYAGHKNFKIDDGSSEPVKIHAEDLARKKKNFGTLLAVMENRKFVDREPQEIIKVEERAEFLPNDCTDISPTGDRQWAANRFVLTLAKKYGDPVVISDDAHFALPEEKVVQDVRLSSMSGNNWKFYGSYHRQDSEEAYRSLNESLQIGRAEVEEWVENSYVFAAKCDNFKFVDRKQLPTKFFPEDTMRHFHSLIQKHGRMDWNNPVWMDRLKKEIQLLRYNGTIDLLPYFFTAEAGVSFYEDEVHKLTGPGRGSAAGLLTSYLLGITHVDPIKYELSMDRFLTQDRIASGKLPDIDQDLPDRDPLIDPQTGWLKRTFGDCYAQISADTTLKLRSSVKDVARATLGKVPSDIERMTKKFENAPQGISDRNFVFGYYKDDDEDGEYVRGSIDYDPALQEYIESYPEQWATVQRCLGLVRNRTRHASAYVIANEPVANFIPLTTVSDVKCTQYDMRSVEAVGGIKMDYLTINSLNDIGDCLRLIQESKPDFDIKQKYEINGKMVPGVRVVTHGDSMLDIWDLPEDQAVFNDITDGRTETVFQFNTNGARRWLKLFKGGMLKSIRDLSDFTALDRPGPLDYKVAGKHNMMVEYANRAKGAPPVGALPILDELFPETHGIIVYQEQIQKAFQQIGETTGAQANAFREHIGKKKMELVFKDKSIFMPKAIEKLGTTVAESLWQSMETFGNYCFNAAHSICYATLGYACAWLKHYYPLQWWCAVLRNASKSEIPEKFWPFCGHLIDLPDINLSGDNFTIVGERIRAPLSLLHGIGPEAHKELCAGRPYSSMEDFLQKMQAQKTKKKRSSLNSAIISKLIVVGSMDSLFPSDSLTVTDKLDLYRSTAKSITGVSPDINARYKFSGIYQKYQIIKEILPEFSMPLIRTMESRGEPGVTMENGVVKYQNEIEGKLKKYHMDTMQNVEYAISDMVWGDQTIEFACPAYVIEDRRFAYQGDKQAAALTLDLEGATREFVKWPDRKGKTLPDAWVKQKSFEGCIVIAILQKYREDRPFSVVDLVLVQPSLKEMETQTHDN